ncbi:ABC transporter ATP-binding protein [Solimonas soli]|uniref:ABC transporter ATP-binding protein n=1 Tax=Solimonas soli TaxID=413479 RepID=UPI0004AE41D6|nr:ABC transporter ATP-binding protein [Solimonas soli]
MNTVSPSDPAAPERIDLRAMPRVLGRLLRLSLRYRWLCALAVASTFGAAIFSLVTPRLLGHAVDQAHTLLAGGAAHADAARHALWWTALLVIGANTIRGLLTGTQGFLGEYIAQRVGYDLRLAFFEKLQRLSFDYHDRVHSGELIARGMLDLEGVRAFIEMGALRVVMLVLLVGVGAWRLFSTDAPLAALALSFVPFVVWRASNMGALLRVTWQKLQALMSDLTRTMEENLQGMRLVRSFAANDFEMQKFDVQSEAALALANRRITVRMGSMSLMNFAYYIAMGLVLYVGGHRVGAGTLTVGTLTEFLAFMTILQQPVRQVGMIVNSSARATSSGARLFEVLDAEPAVRDAPGARELRIGDGVLRFEHVGFAHEPGARPALRDVSFELAPGRTLGIVGPPGSGKSVLANLIPRFYDVSTGRITIDGQDIRDVTLASLRRAVSLVQQEVFLFDTSARDNIAYADPQANELRVQAVASTAQIHSHLAALPKGYGAHVGERGVALSGGQRQRLSIARGLLDDPAILVLDDSSSAIDAGTEAQLRRALMRAAPHRATIIIAHRLSSLKHADEILVLDDGAVVERGTHAQLVALGGHYAELWALQNRAAAARAPAAVELAAGELPAEMEKRA